MTSNDDPEQGANVDAQSSEAELSASVQLLRDRLTGATPDQTLSALDDLESLLTDRHDLPQLPEDQRVVSVPVVEPHAGMAGEHGIEHDGQYTIPLLEDVVKPGVATPAQSPVTLSPMAQRLFDRLASEIDVIVQTGVDDALKAAARDIRKRVKQHVAIVLPEILDELANGDDSDF